MSNLKLDFACADYDRTKYLEDGTVKPVGIELNFIRLPVEDIFWRMSKFQEFDASEMSFSAYLIFRSRPNPPFKAIPVFPSKFFRHSCVFINKKAGIKKPEDLRGRRIGVPEYAMTAIVWLRGTMQHEHGVDPAGVTWVTGGLEEWGRKERVDLKLPPSIRVEPAPSPKTLNEMLNAGEIDALFTARTPSAFFKPRSNVVRLFPKYKQVEMDYYKRTGIYPIMHLVVIKESILKEHPWVAENLYDAFCKSKDLAIKNLESTGALGATLPWLIYELEETRKVLGKDYWSYGVEANRKIIETLAQYSYEQGLSERRLTVEDLFVGSTLQTSKV
ncbi:MAG: ABC transporter substrate-binding protein [Candidatus Tectomicrobia bacterium]|nr:ABC transporter substrate-binding protein [Candidatus Tectomicrobia bacterium]